MKNINKVSFFKPVVGKTLREQLKGKTLAGAWVVEYLRSNPEGFNVPAHWEKPYGDNGWVYGFSLTHLASRYEGRPEYRQEPQVNGFVWTERYGFGKHWRTFTGDPLDMMVGIDWDPQDWILIESE